MKKLLLVPAVLSAFVLFSCASKPSESSDSQTDVIAAPQTDDSLSEEGQEEENQNTSENEEDDVQDVSDEENALLNQTNDNESQDELEQQNSDSESEENSNENYDEETSLSDPVVTTLEPPVTEDDSQMPEEMVSEEDAVPQASQANSEIETEEDKDESTVAEISEDAIDIEDDEISETSSEPIEEKPVVPSRKVSMKVSDYVDITYPGTGWIYMGITDGSRDIAYYGRKLGTGETKFTLQAKNAGTKILHFYKNDILNGNYLDDYIEVEVQNQKGDGKTHVQAPAFKSPVPKKPETKNSLRKNSDSKNESESASETEAKNTPNSKEGSTTDSTAITKSDNDANKASEVESSSKSSSAIKTNSTVSNKVSSAQTTQASSSEKIQTIEKTHSVEKTEQTTADPTAETSSTLLQQAQKLYDERDYKAALEKVNDFFEYAVSDRDTGLYLKGQILEAKSEIQNIKEAINVYNTLTKNYPASKLWDKANKRIIYLRKFYMEAY